MENILTEKKESPRIDENNVIHWYYGDIFEIQWHLTLKENDELITYEPEDQIIFSFYTFDSNKLIHRFICKNIDNSTHMAILQFNKMTSLKFKPGKYRFSVKYISFLKERINGKMSIEKDTQDITTVGEKYFVEVEQWQKVETSK